MGAIHTAPTLLVGPDRGKSSQSVPVNASFLSTAHQLLWGKGGNWELGRRGHAAAGGPQSPGTYDLAAWAKVPGRQPIVPRGKGNRGRQRPARRVWLRRSSDPSSDGSNAIAAIRRPLEELEVIRDADHRPRVPRQHDDGARAEDAIHRTPLEAERGQIASREERFRVGQAIGGARAGLHFATRTLVRSKR